jgi:hypothetical protein
MNKFLTLKYQYCQELFQAIGKQHMVFSHLQVVMLPYRKIDKEHELFLSCKLTKRFARIVALLLNGYQY